MSADSLYEHIPIFTLAAKPVLFLLEYLFKISAGVIAVIVLGAGGSFFGKLGTGFGSVAGVLRQIGECPGSFL